MLLCYANGILASVELKARISEMVTSGLNWVSCSAIVSSLLGPLLDAETVHLRHGGYCPWSTVL